MNPNAKMFAVIEKTDKRQSQREEASGQQAGSKRTEPVRRSDSAPKTILHRCGASRSASPGVVPLLVSVILGCQTLAGLAFRFVAFRFVKLHSSLVPQLLSQVFSKVISIVTVYSKRTRALTFQNFCSPRTNCPPASLAAHRKRRSAHVRRVPNNAQDGKTPRCTLLNP